MFGGRVGVAVRNGPTEAIFTNRLLATVCRIGNALPDKASNESLNALYKIASLMALVLSLCFVIQAIMRGASPQGTFWQGKYQSLEYALL
jgi:hypothetical protein